MSNEVEILEATPYDVGRLGKLGEAFVKQSITAKFMSYHEEGFVNALFRLLSLGALKIWVAKCPDGICGAAGLILSPNLYNPHELLGEICFIDVLPEYQKQGISLKILWAVEDWCRKHGVKALTICYKHEEIVERMEQHGWSLFEYKLIKKTGD